MLLEISKGLIYQTLVSGQPLSREGSFNVPSAHQPGRKDAPWKLKVNGVTTPLAPTAARLTRTTSKCTATLKDAFAAPPVNALSVPTRARSLKHCAPHARSSWTSLRCSSSATAAGCQPNQTLYS